MTGMIALSSRAVATAVAVAWAAPAMAQQSDPLVTDRPDFTESVETVMPGWVQLEGGYTYGRIGDVEGHAIGELLVRVGVTSRLELRLGFDSYVIQRAPGGDVDGLADFAVGAKLNLVAADAAGGALRPSVALLVGSTLPTGADGLGSEELNPEAKLAVSADLGPRVSLSSNIGFASVHAETERFGQFSGSLALGVGVTESVGSYVEVYGFSKETPTGDAVTYVNGGVTYLVASGFQLDARAGVGLNDADPDYFAGAGFGWRLGW